MAPAFRFCLSNSTLAHARPIRYSFFLSVTHHCNTYNIKKGDDSYTVDWYPDVVKEYRREFGELYEKGYIRDDIITLQDDSADITAGKYASRLGIIKPGGEAEQKQLAGGYDYVQIALTEPFVNSLSARAAMNAVSSSSKNPEAAIRMIDVMNTDKEIFNMLNFGIEGTNYTMEDGFVKEIPDSATSSTAAGPWVTSLTLIW